MAPAAASAPEARPVLSLRGISKNFGAVAALRDVRLELRAGEAHALVGENGAGKSTLVKIISGVHQPDGGTIHREGRQISVSIGDGSRLPGGRHGMTLAM